MSSTEAEGHTTPRKWGVLGALSGRTSSSKVAAAAGSVPELAVGTAAEQKTAGKWSLVDKAPLEEG